MNYGRLFCLLPLAYVIWWIYALITWLIPMWSIPFNHASQFGNLSIISIVGSIVFVIGGGILFVFCVILFVMILIAD